MTFGEKITFVRKQKKISQAQLGKDADVNGDIIGKYERDEMKPSIDTAKRIADALDVSLDYLVGNADAKVLDKKTLKRLQDIDNLNSEDRDGILYALDNLLKSAKLKTL